MDEIVYTTSTPLACAVGYPGCDCDRALDGSILPFCECHDCYVCGEIDCDGHA